MASSIPEIRSWKAPQGVHLLLSVGLPTAFVLLGEWWITGRFASWSAVVGLGYTLALALWAAWRVRTHQGPLLKLWFWVVAALGLWAGQAWLEGLPWPATLGLEGSHPFWFGIAFAQGQLAALWAGQLAPRARLFQLVEGVPEGRILEERVRDFQLDADFSRANQGALAASLVVMATTAVFLASFSSVRPASLAAAALAVFLTVCLLVGVLLRTYRREMEALMYGHRFTLADKIAPLGWSLVLAVLAAGGAAALLGLGGPWFDPAHLLPGGQSETPPETPLPPPPALSSRGVGSDPVLALLLALLGQLLQTWRLGAVISLLFTLVLWAIPVVVGAFLLWPLVRWFLSGGRETRGLLRRWRRLLLAQIRAFLEALSLWWSGLPAGQTNALSLGSAGARDWLLSLLGNPLPGRRRPYAEVVEAFLTLARWAEPLTMYRHGETTREFLDRLAPLVPGKASDLVQLRDWLDRELFSADGLDPAERREFLKTVARLTAAPASQDAPPDVS